MWLYIRKQVVTDYISKQCDSVHKNFRTGGKFLKLSDCFFAWDLGGVCVCYNTT